MSRTATPVAAGSGTAISATGTLGAGRDPAGPRPGERTTTAQHGEVGTRGPYAGRDGPTAEDAPDGPRPADQSVKNSPRSAFSSSSGDGAKRSPYAVWSSRARAVKPAGPPG